MLSKRAKRRVGIKIADNIISPPIVGVPDLACSPSKPNFLTCSLICLLRIKLIIRPPKTKETKREVIIARADLNEIY